MIRAFSALLLSLILALTSHSAAVARTSPDAVDQWVLCTGLGTTVIYTDAEGQPTSAPHLCPDCVVHLVAVPVPECQAFAVSLDGAPVRIMARIEVAIPPRPARSHPARAPPL